MVIITDTKRYIDERITHYMNNGYSRIEAEGLAWNEFNTNLQLPLKDRK